jgi:hypothetical protein
MEATCQSHSSIAFPSGDTLSFLQNVQLLITSWFRVGYIDWLQFYFKSKFNYVELTN